MAREYAYRRTEEGKTYQVVASEEGLVLSKAEATVDVKPGQILFPYETAGEFYFGEFDQLWEDWARPYLEGEIESPTPVEQRRIAVQEKFDGMLFFIHRDGDKVWFFTESGRDRTAIFPSLGEEARKLDARSFILVCELVEHGEDGSALPREQMMWTIVGKEPQPERESRIRLNVHDLLFYEGKDVHDEPYRERVALIEEALKGSTGPFQAAGTVYVRTRAQMERAIQAMAAVEGSEGAMLKYADFSYPLQPGGPARAPQVAKFKSIIEIDAQVIGWYRVPKARPPEERWTAKEARRLLPELLEASRTQIYRVAVRFGDRLIPVEATRRLAPGDMEFSWDEENQEWKGTDDPARWEMCRGWENRKPGEVAYGNTYPSAMEGVGCGTILTVAPTVVRVFDRETLEEIPVEKFDPARFDPDKHGLSWIFPKVRNAKEGGRPADVRQILQAFRQTSVAKAVQKAARQTDLPNEEEEEGLDLARLTHEEQRRIAETMFGDPYMVGQPEGKTFRFVMQHHIRGIWGPLERERVLQAVREADRLEGPERQKALEKVFQEYDIAVLREDLEDLRRRVQRASDRREDVAAAIARGLSTEIPHPLALQHLVNRGNVHTDFRFETPGGNYLLGWTLDTPSVVLQFLEDGRIEYLLRNKVLEYQEGDNVICQRKAVQPTAWLEVVNPQEPERFGEPGQLGGTKDTAGGFVLLATGKLVYGVQKSDYHEYFLFFDDPPDLQEQTGGRWGFSLISGGARYQDLPRAFWLANRAFAEPRPYILTHDREEEERKGKREGVNVVWNAEGTLATLREAGYPLPEEDGEKRAQARERDVPEWYSGGYIWVDLYPEDLFDSGSLRVFAAEGLEGAWERIGEFREPQPDPRVPGKNLLKATQGFGFDQELWTMESVRGFLEGLGYGDKEYDLVAKEEGTSVPDMVCKWERHVPILKIDQERRLVLGIVSEPGVVDAHGDIMSPETIEQAYYSFIRSGTVLKLMHREARPFRITQMFLAPMPMAVNGYKIAKGTWLMEVEVPEDEIWEKVKAGELSGFSLHGWGRRRAVDGQRLRELQRLAG